MHKLLCIKNRHCIFPRHYFIVFSEQSTDMFVSGLHIALRNAAGKTSDFDALTLSGLNLS